MLTRDRIVDLNSKPYVIKGPVEVSVVEEWPTQYRTTGLQQRDDRANVSQWVINQFLGGARADKWFQPLDAARYSASTADTRFADHIGPALLEADGTVSGAVAAALTIKPDDSGLGAYGYTSTSPNELYYIRATSGTAVTNTSIGPATGTGYGSVSSGTGVVAGSPVSLVRGANTITMVSDGTAVITFPAGFATGAVMMQVVNGTTTVSGAPLFLPNTATVTTASGVPGGTFTVGVYKADAWVLAGPTLSYLGNVYNTLYDSTSNYFVAQYCMGAVVTPIPIATTTYALGVARHIIHIDTGYVYLASTASSVLRYSRTNGAESASGWTSTPTMPFVIFAPTTMCTGAYDGVAATFCTSGRVLAVTTATGAIASQEFLSYLPISPTVMCYWSGYLFITDGTTVLRYKVPSTYSAAELDIISDVGGNIVPGATINQMIPTVDGVYVVNGTTIHKWYNDSWHYITAAHTGSSYQAAFLFGTYPNNYLVQTYDTAPATVVAKSNRYADLNRFVNGGTFAASSTLTTPIFGGGMDEISGTFFKLRCVGSLSTTETIAVTYGLDGAAATTSLGTFNNTTKEIALNVNGKTIQFKFTFARDSTTAFPDASYFILDYLKQPTARLEYKFNVDMEATTNELKRDPATLYEELTADFNAAPVTLKWNGGDKTVKVLGVKSAVDVKPNKLTEQSVPANGVVQVWCMDVP